VRQVQSIRLIADHLLSMVLRQGLLPFRA